MSASRSEKGSSVIGNFFKFVGGIIPGIDTLVGGITELYNSRTKRNLGEFDDKRKTNEQLFSDLTKATRWGKRIGEIAALTVCILVMAGTLAAPIPGLTPLVALSGIALAKAVGISLAATVGYSAAARFAGSFVGYLVDMERVKKYHEEIQKKFISLRNLFVIPLTMSVIGELGSSLFGVKKKSIPKELKKSTPEELKNVAKKPTISIYNKLNIAPSPIAEKSVNSSDKVNSLMSSKAPAHQPSSPETDLKKSSKPSS